MTAIRNRQERMPTGLVWGNGLDGNLGRSLATATLALAVTATATGQVLLTATAVPNPDMQDTPTRFGINVAALGDITGDGLGDFVVGANFWNDPNVLNPGRGIAQNVGRAYVLSGADFSLVYPLDDPSNVLDEIMFGKFGRADGAGDVNGDGVNDIVTSSYWRTLNADTSLEIAGAGQAFVHSGVDGSLLHTLNDPTPQMIAIFGCYVAGLGDLNGDGISDQGVTAPLHDEPGFVNVGEAHLYSGLDGSLIQTISNPTPQAGAKFGLNLKSLGDTNGDGIGEIIIGAPGQGRAYVFDGGDRSRLFTVEHPDAQTGAKFGRHVAGGIDVTGDGIGDILVSSPTHDVGTSREQGSVFLFSGADGSLIRAIDNPEDLDFAQFGLSVALVSDLDGDGLGEILVGAPDQDGDQLKVGKAFLFTADGALLATLEHPDPQAYAHFGAAVAAGDITGDGYPELFVGSPHDDDIQEEIVEGESHTVVHLEQGMIAVFSANAAPIADAGVDQTVRQEALVTLDGTGSFDPNGDILRYRWIQTAGPAVALARSSSAESQFRAPLVEEETTLSFTLIASDGVFRPRDTVQIIVEDLSS